MRWQMVAEVTKSGALEEARSGAFAKEGPGVAFVEAWEARGQEDEGHALERQESTLERWETGDRRSDAWCGVSVKAEGRRFYGGRRSCRPAFFMWLRRESETAEELFRAKNSVREAGDGGAGVCKTGLWCFCRGRRRHGQRFNGCWRC